MAITISAPAPPPRIDYELSSDDESDMDLDSEGDADMEGDRRGHKKPRLSRKHVVTPGELVTDDTQWMRYNMS